MTHHGGVGTWGWGWDLVGGPPEFNVVCPAITPTLGSELVTNGNMESGDPPDDWSAVNATLDGVADERTGGSGSQSLSVTATNNGGRGQQTISTTTGEWYSIDFWEKVISGSGYVQIFGTNYLASYDDADWTEQVLTLRNTGAGGIWLRAVVAPNEVRYDDVSAKQITFSSALSLIGTRYSRPGTYQCTPTVAANTVTGMLLGYADANNLVMATVDRLNGQARLLKRISGTYTSVISGAIAYGAENVLKVIVAANGTDYSLYYNGVQVGSTTAINDAGLGTSVYGFNTYDGNTVGTVTTTPATS